MIPAVSEDTLSTKFERQTQYQSVGEALYHEFSPACICIVITRVAYAIFQNSFFHILCLASIAFLCISLAIKVFRDYTFILDCERMALFILHKCPYILPVSGIAAAILYPYVPIASAVLGAGIGTLAALTFRVRWLSAVTDWRRRGI